MRTKAALFGLLAALAGAGPALAEFPDKPIRILAPFAPGGNIDVTARIIADRLKDVLGVAVLVENKAGASGMIGSDVVAGAAPDGYTLLVSANGLVAAPAIYGNAPYDWRTAFQPISQIQSVPAVIVVTPSSPIRTFAEFIKTGIDTPGSLSIADSGVGTTNHVLTELMSAAAGAKYTLVHYKGSGQATIDVVAGQVPAMVDQVNSAIAARGDLRQAAGGAARRADGQGARHQGPRGLLLLDLHGPVRAGEDAARRAEEAERRHGEGRERSGGGEEVRRSQRRRQGQHPGGLAAILAREDKVVVPLIRKLGIKAE